MRNLDSIKDAQVLPRAIEWGSIWLTYEAQAIGVEGHPIWGLAISHFDQSLSLTTGKRTWVFASDTSGYLKCLVVTRSILLFMLSSSQERFPQDIKGVSVLAIWKVKDWIWKNEEDCRVGGLELLGVRLVEIQKRKEEMGGFERFYRQARETKPNH